MAARNQHVLDSTVVERRLRPIYEWLDSGNPKKALQEAEKVLRKTPHLQCAKALKALSLLQLGRENECVAILDALTQEIPSDNSTLQAMTICYRDLGKLEKVCCLYEKAVQADPMNEELHTHLFMSYVRTSNFQQQQKSAMVLFKMKPKNPYYFWAIMSILLQATKGQGVTEPNKRNVLLSLAERMVEKLFNENKLEAGQEVQLYLMILELQGKFKEALQVLDGPLGTKLMSGSTDQNRINYLTKLGKWNDLNKFCNDLLSANMDRWDIWNHYLTSMFELSKMNSKLNNHVAENNEMNLEEEPDDSPEKAHEFICSVIENIRDDNLFKSSSSYQLRGPYLARLELCSRLKKMGKDPTYLLGDIFELFVEYFRLFGHKPCCVSDLKIYLNLLESNRRIELAARLLKDVEIYTVTVPQNEKQMQRHICALQLSRLCGSHANLEPEFLKALIDALTLHYETGARHFGTGKLPTDQGPADAYALLAAHTLYDLAIAKKSSTPIVCALILLEGLLKSSPSNFHAKLLCVRLYHFIGAAEGAHKIYESLDTKHLQMDSLGFLHCANLHPSGLFTLTSSLYDATLKFFSTNYRDSIDHLTFSYKYGSFLKLEEFMEFRNRLNNSLHYTLTAIDRMSLEVILCPNLKSLNMIDASPKNNNINWELLRDNNDYNVFVSWDKERINGTLDQSDEIKLLFEQNKDLTLIRAGIVGCVSAALDLLNNRKHHLDDDDDEKEKNLQTLEAAHHQWLDHCQTIQAKGYKCKLMQEQLSLPLPSRIYCYLKIPHVQILDPLFRLVINAFRKGVRSTETQKNTLEDAIELMNNSLVTLCDDVTKQIHEQNNSTEDCLWKRRASLEFIVNTVEVLCISYVLCAISHELLKPVQQPTTNKKGKKKSHVDASTASSTTSDTNHLINTVKANLMSAITNVRKCCVAIDQQLGLWQSPNLSLDLTERFRSLKICVHQQQQQQQAKDSTNKEDTANNIKESVYNYIQLSHSTAIKELRAALLNKCKLLNMMSIF